MSRGSLGLPGWRSAGDGRSVDGWIRPVWPAGGGGSTLGRHLVDTLAIPLGPWRFQFSTICSAIYFVDYPLGLSTMCGYLHNSVDTLLVSGPLVDTLSIPCRYLDDAPLGLSRQCKDIPPAVRWPSASAPPVARWPSPRLPRRRRWLASGGKVGGAGRKVSMTLARGPPPPSPPSQEVSTMYVHHIDHPGGPFNQHLYAGRAARHHSTAPHYLSSMAWGGGGTSRTPLRDFAPVVSLGGGGGGGGCLHPSIWGLWHLSGPCQGVVWRGTSPCRARLATTHHAATCPPSDVRAEGVVRRPTGLWTFQKWGFVLQLPSIPCPYQAGPFV